MNSCVIKAYLAFPLNLDIKLRYRNDNLKNEACDANSYKECLSR